MEDYRNMPTRLWKREGVGVESAPNWKLGKGN